MADGQNHARNGAICIRVRLPLTLQGLNFAQARFDCVIFFGLGVGPILAVILRRQFFLARDETFLFGFAPESDHVRCHQRYKPFCPGQ